MNTLHPRATVLTCTLLIAGTALSACGESSATRAPAATAAPAALSTSAPSSHNPSGTLTITDGWAKATDEHMSAVFGTLTNTTTTPLHITGGSAEVAGAVETHEFVKNAGGSMVMQKAPNGFTIPPGATLTMQPGGNHLMLLELKKPLVNGDPLTVTLTTDHGAVDLHVTIRTFEGAQESYKPTMAHT